MGWALFGAALATRLEVREAPTYAPGRRAEFTPTEPISPATEVSCPFQYSPSLPSQTVLKACLLSSYISVWVRAAYVHLGLF